MKLGVFLCSCGKTSNIKLSALKKITGPEIVEVHDLLCQEDGLSYIVDDVRRKKLDTIIIGCTEKEAIFESLADELAVDLMTLNLREHCGWVHDKEDATEKAKLLLQVGIQRLEKAPVLPTFKVNVGKKVLLLGKSPAFKKLSNELSEAAEVTYIPDKTGKLKSIQGNIGNFTVEIEGNPIDQEKCVTCGKCAPVCPENAIICNGFYYINEKCTKCGKCIKVCPSGAIDFQRPNKVLSAGQLILDDTRFSRKPGIYVVKDELDALTALSEAISNLGEINKDKYLTLNLDQCASGKSGIVGCQICESACPHNAITRDGERVIYEEASCVGCGFCASSCPTSLPQLSEYSNEIIYSQLETLLKGNLKQKIIMFTCECSEKILYDTGRKGLKYPPALPLYVPCLSTVSESHILRALELGADGVLLMKGNCIHGIEKYPAVAFAELFQKAFKLGDRIKIIESDSPENFAESISNFASKLMPLKLKRSVQGAGGNSKRSELIRLTKSFIEMTGISPDSMIKDSKYPFARIKIDKDKCTTCIACTNMCPTEALKRVGFDKISFVYPYCIACSLCEKSCPEKAIKMESMLDFKGLGNDKEEIIMQSELLVCKKCGKPFTTLNAYKKTFGIIEGTGSAGEFDLKEQQELMQLCEDCRAIMAIEMYQRRAYGDTGSH